MILGVNRWIFDSSVSIGDCLDAVKKAGFDSIEINLDEKGDLTPETGESELRAIRGQIEASGLRLAGISTGLGWRYPLTDASETVRARAIEIIRAQVRVAQALGTDAVLVVPGVVNDNISYDDAYARALEGIRACAADAKSRRVHIGVENVWNKFLLSPLEFAAFLDAVGSEYVGAYFDVGNVLVYGYPEQWIKILGKRIRRVHVKDFRTGIGNMSGFCNLLQGDVAWDRVRQALAGIGYNGFVTAEVEGYRTDHALGLKHLAEAMRSVLR